MTVSIGPRIGVEGVKQFRQAFLQITAEAKKFDAEMKKITASFDANDSAMDRNRKIREQLTKQIEKQKGVVKVASDTLKEAQEAETSSAEKYEKVQLSAGKAIAKLAKEEESLRKTQKELKEQTGQSSSKVEELSQKVDIQKKLVWELASKYGEESNAVKTAKSTLEQYEKELDSEKTKLEGTQKALTETNKALDENEKMQSKQKQRVEDASNSLYRASSRVEKYATDLENAETKLGNLNEELRNSPNNLDVWGNRLSDLGGVMEDFGSKLTQYVTTPLAGLGVYAIKSASDVTDGMAKIYTIATESQEPIAQMRQELLALSDQTGYSMDDLTEAAYQAVSASVQAEKTAGFLESAAKLARAGFTTTTQSVDLLTTIINAYGMEVEKADYISDVLLRTQNDGKTIIDELAQSMGTVVPTASAYHVSLEQLAAAYATMTKQGVSTSRATTFLNALFTELESSSKTVAKVLDQQTGKSFAQLMDEGWSLGDVLQVLYDNVDKDSEAFANLFTNIRSGKAANALMADDFSILNNEIERMGDATGQTEYALEQLETPSLKARKAINKLKNSSIDLGETMITEFLPYFEKLIDKVDALTDWFKSLDDQQKKNIISFGLMAAGAGPLIKALGGVLSGVGNALDSFNKIKKATDGASTGLKALGAIVDADGLGFSALVPWVTAAIAAMVALGAAAKISNDQYRESVTSAYKLTDAEKGLIQSSSDLHASVVDMTSASKEEAETVEKNATVAQVLVDRYNDLVEKTGLVTEEDQALADVYLNQLASALGMELDDIKALVDENGRLSGAIDEVIQKKRASAILTAYEDDYTEALSNQSEAIKQVSDLTAQLEEKNRQKKETDEELTYWTERQAEELQTLGYVTDETKDALNRAIIAHGAANSAYEKTSDALEDATESLEIYNSTIENYEGLHAAIISGSEKEIETALTKLKTGFVSAETGTKDSLQKQVENNRGAWKSIKEAFDNGTAGVTQEMVNAYYKLYSDSETELNKWVSLNEKKTDEAGTKVESKVKYHQKPMRTASEGMRAALMEGMDKFKTEAPKAADGGAGGAVSSVHAKVAPMKIESSNLLAAAMSSFNKDDMLGKLYESGTNFAQGFVNGMQSVDVKKYASNWVKGGVTGVNTRLSIESPSKVMEESGQYFGLGFIKGINDEQAAVKKAAELMAQSAVDNSLMVGNYQPTGIGASYGMLGNTTNNRTISAPINVNVNVNGNVDNVEALAEEIAERINNQIIRRSEVFA